MDHVNNIPTGLLVPAQVPLDAKRVVLNDAVLQNLGVDDHLAFTYEDGLIVFSVFSRKRWEWRQRRTPVEEDTALLLADFVYPDGHVIAGINYSLKSYNFFLKREVLPMVNLGTGSKVYKGINVVNEKHEFYTLKTDDKIRLSYPEVDGIQTGVLLFTFPGFENYSNIGTPIFKGYDALLNQFQFYTLDSTDIKIKLDEVTGIINLSLPQTSSVPTIYINQDYVPTYDDWFKANRLVNGTPIVGFQYKGEGTLAKPFTNTVTYTLNSPTPLPITTVANTAIQNGMNYYEGPVSSTSRLNPAKYGQKIQILSSQSSYEYAGDFSYTGLNLEIYGFVTTTTTTDKLVDMDNPAHFINPDWSLPSPPNIFTTIKIYLDDEATLVVNGLGFWNSGYNIAAQNYSYGKVIYLIGKGQILSVQNNVNRYIINSGINPPSPIPPTATYNNAGFLNFEVTCQINCLGNGAEGGQGIIQNGGLGKVEFRDGAIINSGRLTAKTYTNLEAIKITGGFVRIFDSIIFFQGTNNGVPNPGPNPDRTRGIILDKTGNLDAINGPQLYLVNSSLRGNAETWIDRKGNCGVVLMSNCSSIYFGGGDLIKSTGNSAVWGSVSAQGYVDLKNNTFDNIRLDTEKIDLTYNGYQSVSNIIGQNVIQSLRVFYNRNDAVNGGVIKGGLYIKRYLIKDYNATELLKLKIGTTLKIGAQDTPLEDFTTIQIPGSTSAIGGVVSNVLNTYFEYNGVSFSFTTNDAALWYDEICIMT